MKYLLADMFQSSKVSYKCNFLRVKHDKVYELFFTLETNLPVGNLCVTWVHLQPILGNGKNILP